MRHHQSGHRLANQLSEEPRITEEKAASISPTSDAGGSGWSPYICATTAELMV